MPVSLFLSHERREQTEDSPWWGSWAAWSGSAWCPDACVTQKIKKPRQDRLQTHSVQFSRPEGSQSPQAAMLHVYSNCMTNKKAVRFRTPEKWNEHILSATSYLLVSLSTHDWFRPANVYRSENTCWGSVNQVYLISGSEVLLTVWNHRGSENALSVFK